MDKDEIIQILARFFMHEFSEDACGVADWYDSEVGNEDGTMIIDNFYEKVKKLSQ